MATKQTKAPKNTGTMPALLAVADLNKAVDAIIKTAAGLQTRIQVVGVQALMHLGKTGDIGPINRLMVGLPKGVRRNALGSWFLAHGALEVNTDAGSRNTAPLKFAKSKKTDPEAAFAENWFDHLPEKPLDEVFDLQKAIHGLLQRAKGKTIMLHGQKVDASHAVDSLKALAAIAGEDYQPEVKNGAADHSDIVKPVKTPKVGAPSGKETATV